jgi:Rrf2 family protein
MLSMKAKYAIRSLSMLAQNESKMLSIKYLSELAKVPQKFLESILLELKRHKIVDSKRGIQGGYFLNTPAKEITIGNIIRFIDGPLAPVLCASVTAYKKCQDCPTSEERCMLHHIMVDARNALAAVLDNRTLKDMINTDYNKNEKPNKQKRQKEPIERSKTKINRNSSISSKL